MDGVPSIGAEIMVGNGVLGDQPILDATTLPAPAGAALAGSSRTAANPSSTVSASGSVGTESAVVSEGARGEVHMFGLVAALMVGVLGAVRWDVAGLA